MLGQCHLHPASLESSLSSSGFFIVSSSESLGISLGSSPGASGLLIHPSPQPCRSVPWRWVLTSSLTFSEAKPKPQEVALGQETTTFSYGEFGSEKKEICEGFGGKET